MRYRIIEELYEETWSPCAVLYEWRGKLLMYRPMGRVNTHDVPGDRLEDVSLSMLPLHYGEYRLLDQVLTAPDNADPHDLLQRLVTP